MSNVVTSYKAEAANIGNVLFDVVLRPDIGDVISRSICIDNIGYENDRLG